MSVVQNLIRGIESHGQSADDAIRALGLLLEESRVTRPVGDDGGLIEILGPELGRYRLSTDEVDQVVSALSSAAQQDDLPKPGILWALSKSGDPRIIPPLRQVLLRSLDNQNGQEIAEQALNGLMLFQTPESVDAIRTVAGKAEGDLKEQAEHYLSVLAEGDDL